MRPKKGRKLFAQIRIVKLFMERTTYLKKKTKSCSNVKYGKTKKSE